MNTSQIKLPFPNFIDSSQHMAITQQLLADKKANPTTLKAMLSAQELNLYIQVLQGSDEDLKAAPAAINSLLARKCIHMELGKELRTLDRPQLLRNCSLEALDEYVRSRLESLGLDNQLAAGQHVGTTATSYGWNAVSSYVSGGVAKGREVVETVVTTLKNTALKVGDVANRVGSSSLSTISSFGSSVGKSARAVGSYVAHNPEVAEAVARVVILLAKQKNGRSSNQDKEELASLQKRVDELETRMDEKKESSKDTKSVSTEEKKPLSAAEQQELANKKTLLQAKRTETFQLIGKVALQVGALGVGVGVATAAYQGQRVSQQMQDSTESHDIGEVGVAADGLMQRNPKGFTEVAKEYLDMATTQLENDLEEAGIDVSQIQLKSSTSISQDLKYLKIGLKDSANNLEHIRSLRSAYVAEQHARNTVVNLSWGATGAALVGAALASNPLGWAVAGGIGCATLVGSRYAASVDKKALEDFKERSISLQPTKAMTKYSLLSSSMDAPTTSATTAKGAHPVKSLGGSSEAEVSAKVNRIAKSIQVFTSQESLDKLIASMPAVPTHAPVGQLPSANKQARGATLRSS